MAAFQAINVLGVRSGSRDISEISSSIMNDGVWSIQLNVFEIINGRRILSNPEALCLVEAQY